jgi:SulP family sulfate permease
VRTSSSVDPLATSARFRFDRAEWAGAVADVGVLVPIAVALIVSNGLAPTAVLLPAALLYVVSAVRYRLPVPVQPLKAFGAIAIAQGLGVDEIAAGAVLMGGIFFVLSITGWLDAVARIFPRAVIRGIQLAVGLLFVKAAWGLATDPPAAFQVHGVSSEWLVVGTVIVAVSAWVLRGQAVALLLVSVGLVVMFVLGRHELAWGPSAVPLPDFTVDAFVAAATALVLPQLPLTFANSCLAPADAARTYFGEAAARRVTPSRLAASLGVADLFAGGIGGMPVCHGAGGMTAHRAFGARTGGAPLIMGVALLFMALVVGAGLADSVTNFPLPILAGLLATAGILHITLLRDLEAPSDWCIAGLVGLLGLLGFLAAGLVVGILLAWLAGLLGRRVSSG